MENGLSCQALTLNMLIVYLIEQTLHVDAAITALHRQSEYSVVGPHQVLIMLEKVRAASWLLEKSVSFQSMKVHAPLRAMQS